MAQIFNPWKTPPTENTLTGDLASFEINGMDGPEDAPGSEDVPHESNDSDPMTAALKVIGQQADLIAKLMATLGKQ